MKFKGSPFAFIDGQPYIIANFTLDPAFGFPPLTDLLEDLLSKVPGEDVLLLRKLAPAESERLARRTHDAECEAWAIISARFKKRKE